MKGVLLLTISPAAVIEASESLLEDSQLLIDTSSKLESVVWLSPHSFFESPLLAGDVRLVMELNRLFVDKNSLLLRLSDGARPLSPVLDGLFVLSLTLPFVRMRRSKSDGDSEVSRPVAQRSSNCQEHGRYCHRSCSPTGCEQTLKYGSW
jgi:hypothetical protein